jgi:hypothetical protein
MRNRCHTEKSENLIFQVLIEFINVCVLSIASLPFIDAFSFFSPTVK